MTLPLARTNSEAHLYMDLHPCACGATGRGLRSAVVEVDNDLVSRYFGKCESCGTFREFLFRLPDHAVVQRPGTVVYGDGLPSQLLDPGEWLWVADHNAKAVPADIGALDAAEFGRARLRLSAAEAAIGEVLAFFAPPDTDLDADTIESDLGKAVYEREPGRFERARLEAVRAAYRELLATLDRTIAGS
jgi:hypothetical protein